MEAAWKAEKEGELWREEVVDHGYIEGQTLLARHNFLVAKSLDRINRSTEPPEGWEKCPDWVITACYYAMHRAVLAFIARMRWKGRGHEPTLGKLVEILCDRRKPKLAEEMGFKINEARKLRIAASYAVFSADELEDKVRQLLSDTELVLEKLEVKE